MSESTGTTIALTVAGLAAVGAAFVLVDRLTKNQQPYDRRDDDPAPDPGKIPVQNPGGSTSGTSGSTYTYADRCRDLQNQRNTLEGLRQTADQKMNTALTELDPVEGRITHYGLGCIWDCGWHISERSKRIRAYVRGEPVSGYWNERQVLDAADGAGVDLRGMRKRYTDAKAEYERLSGQIQDIENEFARLSRQGVRC